MHRSVLASALAAFCASAPAHAASVVNPNNTVTLDALGANDPFSWSVQLFATAGSQLSGLEALINFTFTGASNNNKTFNFTYTLDNLSTGAGAGSEIKAFGLDATGAPALVSVVGAFQPKGQPGNSGFNGIGGRDVCLGVGQNCNGGGGGAGVTLANGPFGGGFALSYASGRSSITLENFAVRWQKTGIGQSGSASGLGRAFVSPAVPEPASWAMMIGGFGLVGAALRLRRRKRAAAA